ncbi:MAG TPA: hypothetical protein VL490_03075 [Mucilaginibacter sp.]|jgi:hypothetical protein|nr:hypothetical protein [Mucilaginibacter sp.]
MKTISLLIITLLSGNALFAQQSKIVTGGTIKYNDSSSFCLIIFI